MLKIVMIMLCGIGTGYLLRNKKMSFIGRVITALIWVLLFLLGIEVGSEPSYYQWSSDPGTRSHRAYDSRKSG